MSHDKHSGVTVARYDRLQARYAAQRGHSGRLVAMGPGSGPRPYLFGILFDFVIVPAILTITVIAAFDQPWLAPAGLLYVAWVAWRARSLSP